MQQRQRRVIQLNSAVYCDQIEKFIQERKFGKAVFAFKDALRASRNDYEKMLAWVAKAKIEYAKGNVKEEGYAWNKAARCAEDYAHHCHDDDKKQQMDDLAKKYWQYTLEARMELLNLLNRNKDPNTREAVKRQINYAEEKIENYSRRTNNKRKVYQVDERTTETTPEKNHSQVYDRAVVEEREQRALQPQVKKQKVAESAVEVTELVLPPALNGDEPLIEVLILPPPLNRADDEPLFYGVYGNGFSIFEQADTARKSPTVIPTKTFLDDLTSERNPDEKDASRLHNKQM